MGNVEKLQEKSRELSIQDRISNMLKSGKLNSKDRAEIIRRANEISDDTKKQVIDFARKNKYTGFLQRLTNVSISPAKEPEKTPIIERVDIDIADLPKKLQEKLNGIKIGDTVEFGGTKGELLKFSKLGNIYNIHLKNVSFVFDDDSSIKKIEEEKKENTGWIELNRSINLPSSSFIDGVYNRENFEKGVIAYLNEKYGDNSDDELLLEGDTISDFKASIIKTMKRDLNEKYGIPTNSLKIKQSRKTGEIKDVSIDGNDNIYDALKLKGQVVINPNGNNISLFPSSIDDKSFYKIIKGGEEIIVSGIKLKEFKSVIEKEQGGTTSEKIREILKTYSLKLSSSDSSKIEINGLIGDDLHEAFTRWTSYFDKENIARLSYPIDLKDVVVNGGKVDIIFDFDDSYANEGFNSGLKVSIDGVLDGNGNLNKANLLSKFKEALIRKAIPESVNGMLKQTK